MLSLHLLHIVLLDIKSVLTSAWMTPLIVVILLAVMMSLFIYLFAKRKDTARLRDAFQLLEESELKYRTLFEKSIDPILIIGAENTFINCNHSALRILRIEQKDSFIGSHPSVISPKFQADGQLSEKKAEKMIALAHKKGFHHFEWTHKDGNGALFVVEVSLTVISIQNKPLLHVLWHDITEQVQTKKDLVIAKEKAEESDKLKSAFLSNMSHEVRTPMNSILGFSQLLLLPNITEDERRSYVNLIAKSGNQLLSILDNIIDMSTIEAGLMKINEQAFNINHLLEEKHNQVLHRTHSKGLRLILQKELEDQFAVIEADPFRLGQVVDFLLDNAIKFTEKGQIVFGYGIGNGRINFFFQDSGIGIHQSISKEIFNRFRQGQNAQQNHYGGTGLGLCISKAIIENMSGDIHFKTSDQNGTTFFFSIPYKKAKPSRNKTLASHKHYEKIPKN